MGSVYFALLGNTLKYMGFLAMKFHATGSPMIFLRGTLCG